MQRPLFAGILVVIAVLAFIAYSALFTVYETQQALILRFGEARRQITEAGLNYKVPIADTVVFLDKRILDLDSPAQEVIASDQKRLVVDAFARYRITNALRFYQTVGTQNQAISRLANILNSAVRRVLGDSSFEAIVRDDRPELMRRINQQVNVAADAFGIQVIDVRIRRADLPEANSQAVYRRMQTERLREANEFRARGAEEAQRVRSRADRQVVVLEADATRESETIRGEGDALRNEIFNGAFGKDPEFFAFYRSMQAYQNGLKRDDTRMVISPNSDFFRYFNNPRGRGQTAIPSGSADARGVPAAALNASDGGPQQAGSDDASGPASGSSAATETPDASGDTAGAPSGTADTAAPGDGDDTPGDASPDDVTGNGADTSAEPGVDTGAGQ